jgi:hypothetical protein
MISKGNMNHANNNNPLKFNIIFEFIPDHF